MDSEKKLSTAIIETVKNEETSDLAREYAEIGIDSILSDGLLKDLPIVSTIIALSRMGLSINDKIFTKKLLRFLSSLGALSDKERTSMIERLDKKEDFKNKVGDRIIEILDRIDSHAKPEMVAKVFRAYTLHKIDFDMLSRLNHAIDLLPHYEIKRVREFKDASDQERDNFTEMTLNQLVTAGLASPIPGWDGMMYKATKVCETFLSLDLDK